MKRKILLLLSVITVVFISVASRDNDDNAYERIYNQYLKDFQQSETELLQYAGTCDLNNPESVIQLKKRIMETRLQMKRMDFWMRYLEPLAYKKINSPLPVEWETEVFEKFEKPYKREGTGYMLAALYLDEEQRNRDTLLSLIRQAADITQVYGADSITRNLKSYHHFYLCNRLYLLNLAAIYTTGFECPEQASVIPELKYMMSGAASVYAAFNRHFPETQLSKQYCDLYDRAVKFVSDQSADISQFDHFTFIRDYVNPLYAINQSLISQYKVVSRSMVDYSLNKQATSIFDKALYDGQNAKGIFLRMKDEAALASLDSLGKLLFYDPVLSANNERSCASCHKATQYFTDTATATALQFDQKGFLARNTPSLINAQYNHLIMQDGKHFTLQHQTKAVITNPEEMASDEQEVLKKVLSCKVYKDGFTRLLKYTPQEPDITLEHILSAITYYYSKFSKYYSPFDDAMNNNSSLSADAREGFNLFMGKAQCATCHFVPQFNGVKPPYIGSEFEVLGVPSDTAYTHLSADKGRYGVNPAKETLHAFRTGTVRNSVYTAPYMHNGVFRTLDQVVEFYNSGGGAGHGLAVDNQTLSADSLNLSLQEKQQLIAFIRSLNEHIPFEDAPLSLPVSNIKSINKRKVGGSY